MLSILSRQFATRLSLGASPAAHARRTFLTSSSAAAVAKKPSTTTKTTTRSAATKTKPTKSESDDGKKKKKKKDTHVVLHKEDKPPRVPPNAYACFIGAVSQGVKNLDEAKQSMATASEKWKALPENEKQKYVGQAELLRSQYEKDLASYWKTVDPETIKELNRRRVEQGKKKLKIPRALNPNPRPTTAFFRYLAFFRETPEARALHEGADSRLANIAVGRAAGTRWKEMSDAEKAPYIQASEKAKKTYHANKKN